MEIIWPSPAGVDHLTVTKHDAIPGLAQGRCSTCGRMHNIGHAFTVRMFPRRFTGPCAVEFADWPYDCDAKDQNPGATVYRCTTHGIWWYEPAEGR